MISQKNKMKEIGVPSKEIRKEVVRIISKCGASHLASCLSCVEILMALYYHYLNIDPIDPKNEDRDRLILSKGHAAAVLYIILAYKGFYNKNIYESFYLNSGLPGHVTINCVPGIEFSTGSLGHGLSVAAGMALAGKRDKKNYRVFCILSDGECDEGSTWEAAIFAAHYSLDNLIAIVDYNKYQAMGRVEEIMKLEPLALKWEAFGWSVKEINGNDMNDIEYALKRIPFENGKPNCLIAHTIKGKGVSFMENNNLWHYRTPNKDEYEMAMKELEEEK